MIRGVRARTGTMYPRVKEPLSEDLAPFTPVETDAAGVTVHDLKEATLMKNLIGGGAKVISVNAMLFKQYVRVLEEAAKATAFKFGYGDD